MLQTIADLLPSVIRSLQEPQKILRQQLVDKWDDIAGGRFAPHTKPTLNEKGELCVWCSHSVVAFELQQKYKNSILKRAQAVLGEGAVTSVRFRVGELR